MLRFKPSQSDVPRLKQPFGQLITGEPKATMSQLKSIIRRANPNRISAVGDVVSRETLKAGIRVNLRIIDRISMRKPSEAFDVRSVKTYRVKNPAGFITQEAWNTIKEAMRNLDALIIVDGEEDLLTLPSIVESPENAFVLYGQPNQGLVVVTTGLDEKHEANGILSRMIIEDV